MLLKSPFLETKMWKKTLLTFAALTLSTSALAVDIPTVKIGATPTAVPFNFLDPKTNTLQGVMIDLSQSLGDELGFKPDIMPIPFASLVPSLQTDRITLISSAFSVTPTRAEVVDFTQIILTYGEALVVPKKDTKDYKHLEEFKGKTIGVQIGTSYVEPLKAIPGIKEVKMYDTMADLIRDVSLGRLDGAIGDGPSMTYQVESQGINGVRHVKSYESIMPTTIALAVKKGNSELLDHLNKGLDRLRENGSIDTILAKWKINTLN